MRREKVTRSNPRGSGMAAKKKRAKGQLALAKAPSRSRGRIRAEGAEFPVPSLVRDLPEDYPVVLADIKRRIVAAQTRAARAASRELIALYFHVGCTIASRQAQAGWGQSVVERLAFDLRTAFPEMAGFSARNIWRMRAFFRAWAEPSEILPQAVAEIGLAKKLPQAVADLPWGHNVMLLEQVKSAEARLWYAEQAREGGWSRAVLGEQIERKSSVTLMSASSNVSCLRTLGSFCWSLARASRSWGAR